MGRNVLIAEDDSTSRELLSRMLSQTGYAVSTAMDGEDALNKLDVATSVVILDLRMPKVSGFGCLEDMVARQPHTPIIVVSNAGTRDAVTAMQKGAFSYIQKPYKREEILTTVQSALAYRERNVRKSEYRNTVFRQTPLNGELVSEISSVHINEMLSTPGPIVLFGETGTPKLANAAYIHDQIKGSKHPLVNCNLEVIPAEMIEGELFGDDNQCGRLALATGGTLLIGEIAHIPFHIQERIIPELRRSSQGSEKSTQWVFTSQYRLADLVDHGFLQDGIFKLLQNRVVPLPSLREERFRIVHLAEAEVSKLRSVSGLENLSIRSDTINQLIEYNWPGNHSQMYQVLARAARLANGGEIAPEHLHLTELKLLSPERELVHLAEKPLSEIENYFISWQLRKHGGNRAAAARSLGITDRTIFNRIRKFGLFPHP
ncbi:MAG: sigma-54-dependent Fis family transcriptional regulator [Bdellovibrionales bacterium]|nr:sigma-54-dependent Fis family transcriptional regulator [Bdellovibrionales bacterium]